MSDKDLYEALKKGDLITVGPENVKGAESDPMASLPVNLDIDYFQYNSPIGIDFTKTCSPAIFLLHSQILDYLGALRGLDTEIRYNLELMRGELYQGKLQEYRTRLQACLKPKTPPEPEITSGKGKEKTKAKMPTKKAEDSVIPASPPIPMDPMAAMNLLLIFLNRHSMPPQKWLGSEKFLEIVENPDQMKAKLRDIRGSVTFQSDSVQTQLILSSIAYRILEKITASLGANEINRIRHHIEFGEWEQLRSQLLEMGATNPGDEKIENSTEYVIKIFSVLQYLFD
jgi:hypothetical protein